MLLNKLSKECFENAKAKGFHSLTEENKDFVIPRDLMLIVTELSEAMEALRQNKWAELHLYQFDTAANCSGDFNKIGFEAYIKDRFEDEISDTFIRLFHLCGLLNIDIDAHVKLKMEYNKTREHKHGKRF